MTAVAIVLPRAVRTIQLHGCNGMDRAARSLCRAVQRTQRLHQLGPGDLGQINEHAEFAGERTRWRHR